MSSLNLFELGNDEVHAPLDRSQRIIIFERLTSNFPDILDNPRNAAAREATEIIAMKITR